MKSIRNIIVFILTIIIQFSVIIGAMVLEDFSTKRMGVARYLVYKKQEFESTYFTGALMNLYTLILVIGAAVCTFLLMILWKKRKGVFSLIFAIIANLGVIILIQLSPQLQAYHFFLIGTFIVIIIQYIRILYALFR
jgi:hypothetical protein